MRKIVLIMTIIGFILGSCSSVDDQRTETPGNPVGNNDDDPEVGTSGEWSIPIDQVLDGGPGKDGIPALENPDLVIAAGVDYLSDDDFVIGFKNGDDVRAYPHIILDWHEIINDKVGGVNLAVTYCPLTGTGIGWNRFLEGGITTFGVSGLLYNTNLIPYDRASDSNWSQILNESVNGNARGEQIDLLMLVETNWKTWKTMYPLSKVVSTDTGFSRTYGISPYGDYKTNNELFLFPVTPKDNRLPPKERVLTIVDGDDAKAYRFNSFSSSPIIRDTFKGKEHLLVGNEDFLLSFELEEDKAALEFEYIFDGSDIILADNEGNQWDIFGKAVSGPRSGEANSNAREPETLKPSSFFMAFWFSIPPFYTTEIY